MLMVCIISVIFGAVSGAVETPCKSGWLAYSGSCYLFGRSELPMIEAEHYCKQHGGNLVIVNDERENLFLKDHMRYINQHHWWIGISDEAIENVWQLYGTDQDAPYLDFMANDHAHPGEDCALFQWADDFKWVDTYCDQAVGVPLCEYTSEECGENPSVGIVG